MLNPTITVEFWDTEGELVMATFGPSGDVDAVVLDPEASPDIIAENEDLMRIKGMPLAMVGVMDETKTYRKTAGYLVAPESTIDELVAGMLNDAAKTYENLRQYIAESERGEVLLGNAVSTDVTKRILN